MKPFCSLYVIRLNYTSPLYIHGIVMIIVWLVLTAIMLTSCAPIFTTSTLVPAKGGDVSKLNPIAVVGFSGRGGNILANEVEATLVSTNVQGRPYFTVVDRKALDKVLQEIGFSHSGAVDEKTAVRIGKLVGAKGVVLGAVGNNGAFDTGYTEERTECLDKDRKAFSFKPCKIERRYTVRCVKRDAHFSFTPKIIDVQTGQIVMSKSVTGSVSDKSCRDHGPVAGKAAMLSDAEQAALGEFRKLVSPYTQNVSFMVLTYDSTERPERATEMMKQGATWAKSGRLDRACKLWRESYQIHPYGYAAHYNLGLCEEYHTRNLNAALKYYQEADDLSPEPVKAISQALSRVRKGVENQKKLDDQLGRKPSQVNHDVSPRPGDISQRDVKFVKVKLNGLGYDAGTPDGVFGPRTQSVIQEYQRDQGLRVTGTITRSLINHLMQSNVIKIKKHPNLPWPLPKASARVVIPDELLPVPSNRSSQLTIIDNALSDALTTSGYVEKSYYQIPGGFALVTRIERINSDGTPHSDRWSPEIRPLQNFSLKGYLRALFTAERGYFRIIVFTVTSFSYPSENTIVSVTEATSWLEGGEPIMNQGVIEKESEASRSDDTIKYNSIAHIYEFEKYNSKSEAVLKIPGNITGMDHLYNSMIYTSLEK